MKTNQRTHVARGPHLSRFRKITRQVFPRMDTTPSATPPPEAEVSTEDKTVAIVAYLTLIGFLVALILHSNKKTKIGAFHLRQALGLILTGICASFIMVIPILGWIAGPIIALCVFVFAIMGFIGAIQGKMNPVPLLGAKYQQWFGGAFN
jgi:uncharacterized membrane protein